MLSVAGRKLAYICWTVQVRKNDLRAGDLLAGIAVHALLEGSAENHVHVEMSAPETSTVSELLVKECWRKKRLN